MEEKKAIMAGYVQDCNRLVKALLEAGANPDMLGHPFPYSLDGLRAYLSDEEYNTYFQKGTRALNETIKKGMDWESQVDLLLNYTDLDWQSVQAAEDSGDPRMIEKINTLWAAKKDKPASVQPDYVNYDDLDLALSRAVQSTLPGYAQNLQIILDAGANPNHCDGIKKWGTDNPLYLLATKPYYTWYKKNIDKKIATETPEIQKLNIVLNAGANKQEKPYAWYCVNKINNTYIDLLRSMTDTYTPEQIEQNVQGAVADANRLLRALLEAGADPNAEYNRSELYPDDTTSPLSEAIYKGMAWESQIDLLLQYATVDAEDLKVAQYSIHPEIEQKIRTAWEAQQN
jgi:hypothetical protein